MHQELEKEGERGFCDWVESEERCPARFVLGWTDRMRADGERGWTAKMRVRGSIKMENGKRKKETGDRRFKK